MVLYGYMVYNASMKSRYQYRIYPSEQQRKDLARLFGCVRVVWNDALALCKKSEKLPSNGDLQKICITQAKKTQEREWLSEVSNIPLQQSIADLGVAWNNFFASIKGKRKGKKVNPPKFKKRTNRQSARFRKGGFSIKAAKVFLAKIGCIKTKWSRPLPSEPSSVTVIKDTAGRYFLSFVVEVQPETKLASNPAVGIDLGIKIFAALSTSERVASPSYSKLDRKIRRSQRKLSRRSKTSKRRERMRLKVAKLKAKLRDIRKDFLHKLSTKVINENQVIALEDLNVSGLLKNRKLSRAISSAGWREFRTMCESKSEKFGREASCHQQVGTNQPSLFGLWLPLGQVRPFGERNCLYELRHSSRQRRQRLKKYRTSRGRAYPRLKMGREGV